MPITSSSVKVSFIQRGVYAVVSGNALLVIERAKFELRRGGRRLGHWLKYLVGKLSTTGEKVIICLGKALRDEIESWILSSNGSHMMYVYRLFEHMIRKLGFTKCLAIALIALEE